MSANYVSSEEWAAWEDERQASNDAWADERHAVEVRNRPHFIDALKAEIADLEAREWFTRECLTAALEIADDLRERLTFEQDLLTAVLTEQHGNPADLRRAA